MTVELSDYAQSFVDEKLAGGSCSNATEVIDEALRDLEGRREREETIRAVKQGVAEAEAGRVCSVEEAFRRIDERYPFLKGD